MSAERVEDIAERIVSGWVEPSKIRVTLVERIAAALTAERQAGERVREALDQLWECFKAHHGNMTVNVNTLQPRIAALLAARPGQEGV